MKKKIYKTVIQITVLSEDPIPDGMDIEEITSNCYDGDYCGKGEFKKFNIPITGKNAADAVYDTGSDPEFFQMDDNGNEIEI